MTKILTDQLHLDSVKSSYGDSEDLQLYHDGSDSYINDTGTGHLVLNTNGASMKFLFGSEFMAQFEANGSVDLYHNNVKKFETTSTGVSITGQTVSSAALISNATDAGNPNATTDQLRVSGYGVMGNRGALYFTNALSSGNIQFGIGGAHAANTKLTITNTTATFTGAVTTGGELSFSSNNTGVTMKDASGTTTRVLRLNSSNAMYIGPIDSYAGGEVFYGTASEVTGHKFYVGGAAALSVSAGNITFPTGYLSDYIYHTGDTNTYFGFNANDQFRVNCAGSTKFNVTSTQINTYGTEITTSGSPQYFTYTGSGSQTLVFRENGPGGYKNSIIASAGGGVQLFYNNSEKLVTVSGGVSLGNNTLYLGQYSGINLNGVGPSAGKVVTGTGSSTQLTWNDSVANISVGTGLDVSSSTSNGAITKNITLDFNELPVIDGDDPQADWFIVESSEDENSKISRSDLQSVDAHWKTFQTVINSNFDDRSSSTSIFYMPLNYISETTSANYYNTFACPRGGTVKRIMMMHTAGSTMSTSFTTELSIFKNALLTSSSGELTPSNGSLDGSNITWSPNYTFTAGDRLNFRYQKSATSKYWYGVSVSIIIEFDTI
jgi:hypothetical protein